MITELVIHMRKSIVLNTKHGISMQELIKSMENEIHIKKLYDLDHNATFGVAEDASIR
jgi:hypothetical protein